MLCDVIISISAPVDDLTISEVDFEGTYRYVTEGGVVNLIEGVEGGISCRAHVQGSLTPPEMRIYIDDVEKMLRHL